MSLKIKNNGIIYWSRLIEDYKTYTFFSSNQMIINNNRYILLLLLFKYFILKDISNIDYNVYLNIYNNNIYLNIFEFRLYYLLYYIIIENNLIQFLWFLHIQLVENQKLYWIDNSYNYFHENYIHIYIYLFIKKQKFLLNYSKFKYYKNNILLKKIFIYNEFILKVDYTSLYIYMSYIEYFRRIKYNEYISNNKLLWNYPKLKKIFLIRLNKSIKYKKLYYRKMLLLNCYNIYYIITNLDLYKYINENLLLNNNHEFNKSIILNKKLSIYRHDNFLLDNKRLIIKVTDWGINKFIKFINPIIYSRLINLFKNILLIYIIFISHEIYDRYIILSKKLRKIKLRHLISIHYKYQNMQFKFIIYIYKYYFKNYTSSLFLNHILINYGFLSFYFLEDNNYIINYIKKNILLYRIINIFISRHINMQFNKLFNYIDVDPHKANSFKNPSLQKMWNINYIRHKRNKSPIHSPIYSNIFKGYNYENKINNVKSFNKNIPIAKNSYKVKINWDFIFFWKAIIKWSFIKFYCIINFIDDDEDLFNLVSNYKYSLELIFWEIINSNNKNYISFKYFNHFNILTKNIKKTNIINIFLNKYFNSIVNYFLQYNKDHWINISFCYVILKDYFIFTQDKRYSEKNRINDLINKNFYVIDKYRKNYWNFFSWQMKNFLSLLRFKHFYFKHEYTYYMEYFIPITYSWEINYKLWLDNLKNKMINEWEKISEKKV